jgi:formylglycine-generating enzyme
MTKKTAVFLFAFIISSAAAMFSGCAKNPVTPAPDPTPYATPPSFAAVPGGTFSQTDGYMSFDHTISSFHISKHEVTYEQWYLVRRWALSNGYVFSNDGIECFPGPPQNLDDYYAIMAMLGAAPTANRRHPVTMISWRDAIVWCNAFSVMDGLVPVYCSDAAHTTPVTRTARPGFEGAIDTMGGSADNPYVNWDASGYRLPTLGEWEYAARYINGVSWTPINYASGAVADNTDLTATAAVAWFSYNSGLQTHDAGLKTPNALGIYDMSGNVSEYIWDWEYGSYYLAKTDYRGPAGGSYRCVRGGSEKDGAYNMILTESMSASPCFWDYFTGFRIVKK